MKKILSTLAVVLCCAMTTTVHAQDKVEQALKLAEQKAKFADENVENGKVQYEAAISFISDDLGEKKDLDRALTYANRALKIAQEHPAPQDTLKGLTCYALGMIYMWKQSWENSFDFMQMAMDAFQEELGRYDPVTNGTKLIYGYFIWLFYGRCTAPPGIPVDSTSLHRQQYGSAEQAHREYRHGIYYAVCCLGNAYRRLHQAFESCSADGYTRWKEISRCSDPRLEHGASVGGMDGAQHVTHRG